MPNPGADTLPSPERLNRLCVRRYGNTSSGSLWYALSYIESCQRVKKGEIVWQVSTALKFVGSSCWLNV